MNEDTRFSVRRITVLTVLNDDVNMNSLNFESVFCKIFLVDTS